MHSTLAERLEPVAVRQLRRIVDAARTLSPPYRADVLETSGGIAVHLEFGSPLNHAIGVGLVEPFGPGDIRALDDFYAGHGERAVIALCDRAHPRSVEALLAAGWMPDQSEDVLVLDLSAGMPSVSPSDQRGADIEVAEACDEEERDLWALLAATGFSAPLHPLSEQLRLASAIAAAPASRLFIARVAGAPAGVGELYMDGDIAWLSADTTLPAHRGKGVQFALQRARLARAVADGCTLAVSEAAPDSASERNMLRHGFHLAYTRTDMVAPGRQSGFIGEVDIGC